MARLLLALLLCGVAAAQERAFVEVTAGKDAYYAGESIDLKLRFGFDRDFFRDHAVPLFAREMDVPVQVLGQLPGSPGIYDPAERRKGPRFAFGEAILRATSASEETREGRVFTVLETTWRTIRPEAGELEIAAPALRYAYATEFHEDFVMGRVARDPRQEVVSGTPLKLRILPLPEEGRPPEFNGAVGPFTLSAEASRTSLAVGDTLILTVGVEGHGSYSEPDVDLRGFHVLGTIRSGLEGGRSARHHLRLLSTDVKEIPGVRLAFFDPGPPAGYRVVSTDPIPLQIQGSAAQEPPPPPPAGRSVWPILVVVAVAIAGAAVWARSRRRVAPPDPHRVRVERALAAVRASGNADTFAELLAAYLQCPSAAVIGPDLPARLAAKGMKPALAARAAAALESLVAARYGGGPGGAEELRALLPEIEAATGGAGPPTSGSPAAPR